MTPSPESLSHLIALAEKATSGEWVSIGRNGEFTVGEKPYGGEELFMALGDKQGFNSEFVAAARNSIPALTALLAQHQQLREWVTERAGHAVDCGLIKTGYQLVSEDEAKLYCTCGLSKLRESIHA